jgi:hypothetical protein
MAKLRAASEPKGMVMTQQESRGENTSPGNMIIFGAVKMSFPEKLNLLRELGFVPGAIIERIGFSIHAVQFNDTRMRKEFGVYVFTTLQDVVYVGQTGDGLATFASRLAKYSGDPKPTTTEGRVNSMLMSKLASPPTATAPSHCTIWLLAEGEIGHGRFESHGKTYGFVASRLFRCS